MLVRMQRTGGYLHKGMDQPPNNFYGKWTSRSSAAPAWSAPT
jgi:hypothetical protein